MKIMLVIVLAAALSTACGSAREEAVSTCAAAILSFDVPQVEAKCDSLSKEDQRAAAKQATEKSGVIVFLPPYEAKEARSR